MAEHYYTYYSYEKTPNGRGYIGSRGSYLIPEKDDYFGSFTDGTFNPTEKIIIGTHSSRIEAYNSEVSLHYLFKVDIDPHFANKSRAKPGGFLYSPKGKSIWNREGVVKSFDQDPGEGWEKGFPSDYKRESKNKGKNLWFNPNTGERGYYFEKPSPDWIKGTPKEWRKNMVTFTSENNPMKGKKGEDHPCGGTRWWNNPETSEARRCDTSPGQEWEEGRGELGPSPKTSERNSKCRWYNNGKGVERFCEICPEGWNEGRARNPNSVKWRDPYDGFTSNAGAVSIRMRSLGRDPKEKERV